MRILSAFVLLMLAFVANAAELLVLNKSEASLSFIDPASGKTLKTIATGEGPHEMEISADGKRAYASNYGASTPGNTLSVVDVPARSEIQRVDLGELRRPHGLSLVDGALYLTAEAAKRVARFDTETGKVDWQFETGQDGTHMVLAARDGKTLFTTNMGSNNVSILRREANDKWSQTLIAVGDGPEALDLTPDGKHLWVAHSRDGGVSIIDVAEARVIKTFDAKTQRSNRLKFTRDGKLVLISDLGAGNLVVLDADTQAERARIAVGRYPTGILIPPAGNEAYLAVSGENHLAVIDLGSLKIVRTIATGGSPDGMAWVP